MKKIKIEPVKINKNWFENTQRMVDKIYQKTIDYDRNQFVNKIVELEQELQKYKSLYQNEKEHTDTLKRIFKKIEEYIEENMEFKKSTFYGLPDYYVFKGDIENVLNLLKEIK